MLDERQQDVEGAGANLGGLPVDQQLAFGRLQLKAAETERSCVVQTWQD